MSNKFFIIIPSRIGSTRLKKKPLIDIGGISLIQRVFNNAINITSETYVATDSNEIFAHVSKFTKNIIMTSSDHISGTDRVYEAATELQLSDNDLVINLQGDEPFMPNGLLKKIIDDFFKVDPDVISACHSIVDNHDLLNKNCVKVIINENGYADAFKRDVTTTNNSYVMRHIGVYGYKYKTLSKIVNLKPTKSELNNKLEQLRFLDNNLSIYMTEYDKDVPPGIDTDEDLKKAEAYLKTL